jgi:hypothetical protein
LQRPVDKIVLKSEAERRGALSVDGLELKLRLGKGGSLEVILIRKASLWPYAILKLPGV